MASKEPTIQYLIDGAVATFQKDLKTKIPDRKGFIFTMLASTAGLAKICLKYGRAIFNNNFIHLADAEGLEKFAKEYSITMNQARPAHILVEVSEVNVNVKTIPISTTFVLENLKFSSTENADIHEKKTLVNAMSQKSRFFDNLKIDTELDMEERFGDNQIAKIKKIFDIGADTETLEEFRKRLLGIIRNAGATGTQPYYIKNTLKIAGVQEAFVFRGKEVAQVAVYPIMQGFLLPTEEEKKRILKQLQSDKIAVIGDYVTVGELKFVKVKVNINSLAPSSNMIREKIKNSLKIFLQLRKPMQHNLEKSQISSISHLDIYQIITEAGGLNASITLKVDEKITQMYILKSPAVDGFEVLPELAVLEEISFA